MHLLATLAAALLAGSSLEELVRSSDRIAVAQVVAVHTVVDEHTRGGGGQRVRVAELRVERALVGPLEEERVCAVVAPTVGEVGAGDRALFFLGPEPMPWWRERERTAERLRRATRGAPLFQLHADGVWWLYERGGETACRPPRGALLPGELASAGPRPSAQRVVTWVDARVEALTPSLSASYASTGPSPWRLRVEADGTWTEARDPPRSFAAGELAHLWRVVDEAGFAALPENIGASRSPDSTYLWMQVRTRRGVHRVSVHPLQADDGAEVRAARERALRVWDALPGERKP